MSRFVQLMKRYFGSKRPKGILEFTAWDHLKGFETLQLKAYKAVETEEFWTIGYGHYGPDVTPGMRIDEARALALLDQDLEWAETAVRELVKVPLEQNEHNALVSFVFNVGRSKFSKSTMLKLLNKGDYQAAADEFPKWRRSGGQILRGLERRRASERAMFLGDA